MRLTATRASVTSTGGAGVTLAFLEYTTTPSTSSFTLLSRHPGNYEVDWGDGTIETHTTTNPTHAYSAAGEYVIKITPAVGFAYQPYFNANTSVSNIAGVDGAGGSQLTSLNNSFRGGNNITSFSGNIDTSNVAIFTGILRGCNKLATMPFFNASSATSFVSAWRSASNLANFPANVFDTTGTLASNAFNGAWLACALTAQSIENILVSLDTNGATGVTLDISGGTNAAKTTWSAAANTAHDNLVLKGWNISAN